MTRGEMTRGRNDRIPIYLFNLNFFQLGLTWSIQYYFEIIDTILILY